MIKNLFFTVCAALCLCFSTQNVDAQVWDNGDGMVHIGVGLGGYSYSGATSLPAIGISYDKALKNDLGPGHLSIGGAIGFKYATEKYDFFGDSYRFNYSNTFISARGLYHWDAVNQDKWDLYAGLVVGARLYRFSDSFGDDLNNSSFNILIGGIIGGQYFFTDRLGIYGEMGYSIGYINLGLTMKL